MATTVIATSEDAKRVLIEQIQTCVSASWAVAWATPNAVFDAALARIDAFNHFVVGTNGSQTHPSCLRALSKHPSKAFIRRNSSDLFHPKLYLFEHLNHFSVVIGSHNLTHGAFTSNDEVSLLIELDKTDSTVKKLLEWIKDASKESLCVVYSEAWISEYEELYKLGRMKRKEIDEQRKDTSSKADMDRRKSRPINLSWEEWYKKVSSETSPSHDINRRLAMLEYIGQLFKDNPEYSKMQEEDRLRISGLANKAMVERDGIDWGYFGSMKPAQQRPIFKTLVIDEPEGLSNALNILPLAGPVNEDHWTRYWSEIRRIDDRHGSLGRGLASRLAALRRPDVFVSLNGASASKLAELLDVSPNRLVGENYWKYVIQEIQRTNWYLADEPKNLEQARAWRVRAALLDSIVYRTT